MKHLLTIGLLVPLISLGQSMPEYKVERPLVKAKAVEIIKKRIEQQNDSGVRTNKPERSASELRLRKDMVAPRERRD